MRLLWKWIWEGWISCPHLVNEANKSQSWSTRPPWLLFILEMRWNFMLIDSGEMLQFLDHLEQKSTRNGSQGKEQQLFSKTVGSHSRKWRCVLQLITCCDYKQIKRDWSATNPSEIHESLLHSDIVTLRCAISVLWALIWSKTLTMAPSLSLPTAK